MAKQEKTSQDIKLPKARKCTHCGEHIYNIVELAIRPVVLSVKSKKGQANAVKGGKVVNRAFHFKCLEEFNKLATDVELSKLEDSDWDKCYKFFKDKYLKVTKSADMKFAVERIKGLRVGKFRPSGSNTKFLKVGYSYDTIYKTMVFVYPIAMANASTMKFKDLTHKVNYLMKFIESEIPNVQYKLDSISKANESTEKAVVKDEKVFDHYESYKEMATTKATEEKKPVKSMEEILGTETTSYDAEFEW